MACCTIEERLLGADALADAETYHMNLLQARAGAGMFRTSNLSLPKATLTTVIRQLLPLLAFMVQSRKRWLLSCRLGREILKWSQLYVDMQFFVTD